MNEYSSNRLAILLLVIIVLWTETDRKKRCTNYNITARVTTQQECQTNCVNDSECVGIVYSNKAGYTDVCYICKDDNLLDTGNNFGFYKRPGNEHGYQFKLLIDGYIFQFVLNIEFCFRRNDHCSTNSNSCAR